MVRKFVKKNPEYRDLEVYLMMALLKKWYNLSYRCMVDELNCSKALRKRLGFKHTPPKSTMWCNVHQLLIGLLDEIAFTAGTATKHTLVPTRPRTRTTGTSGWRHPRVAGGSGAP